LEVRSRRKTVEAVIDLNRIESLGVPAKRFGPHVSGIERADPVLVGPSRRTDVNVRFLPDRSNDFGGDGAITRARGVW